MKGLDVAEAFFNEFGLPALSEHFPDIANRLSDLRRKKIAHTRQ